MICFWRTVFKIESIEQTSDMFFNPKKLVVNYIYFHLFFRLLGQGAFGEVYEGTLKNMCANISELSVAVKVWQTYASM